jgi:hypothetical protein
LAAGDCECIHHGWLAQPSNALSSLAYVVALVPGFAAGDAVGRLLGVLIASNGPAGVAYHGPGGLTSHVLHDGALGATLGAMAARDLAQITGTPPLATVAAGGVAGAVAAGARRDVLAQLGLGALVLACEGWLAGAAVRSHRSWRRRFAVPAALMGAGAVLHSAGRTGSPLCRPASRWQPHAAWHLVSAAALTAWLRGATRERSNLA